MPFKDVVENLRAAREHAEGLHAAIGGAADDAERLAGVQAPPAATSQADTFQFPSGNGGNTIGVAVHGPNPNAATDNAFQGTAQSGVAGTSGSAGKSSGSRAGSPSEDANGVCNGIFAADGVSVIAGYGILDPRNGRLIRVMSIDRITVLWEFQADVNTGGGPSNSGTRPSAGRGDFHGNLPPTITSPDSPGIPPTSNGGSGGDIPGALDRVAQIAARDAAKQQGVLEQMARSLSVLAQNSKSDMDFRVKA